jgi:crossover junction endodeoxyribonuclease RuvC
VIFVTHHEEGKMGSKIFVGIDVGITGAVAVLNPETNDVRFYDNPVLEIKVGKHFKNVPDTYQMAVILEDIATAAGGKDNLLVSIEKVQAMPGGGERSMGATSAFSFGCGFGMWLGVLAALRLPHQQIHPATWKARIMAGFGKEKDASRQVAMQHYPRAAKDLNLKKHHGRADAALLARFGWLTYGGQPASKPKESLFE